MMKEKKTFQPLTSENICKIYKLLHKEGVVSFPLTSDARHKVEASITNINGNSFGSPHYPTIEQKVIAYFYFLIKNHPFTDGNKRTATLTFLVLCDLNEVKVEIADFDLATLAVFLEQFNQHDHQNIIKITAEAFIRPK